MAAVAFNTSDTQSNTVGGVLLIPGPAGCDHVETVVDAPGGTRLGPVVAKDADGSPGEGAGLGDTSSSTVFTAMVGVGDASPTATLC
jgi:hypothetical protein